MLGCPDAVQGGEIRLTAVLSQDKEHRYAYDKNEFKYANSDELLSEMKGLRLLLQAACGNGGTWAGDGVLYFWIRDADLAAMRFDRCFALLAST